MAGLEKITAQSLRDIIKDASKIAGKDYLVVDVRRTDFEVWLPRCDMINDLTGLAISQNAFIRGAVNLPAHSFYPTVESVANLLYTIPLVIFHCNSCSEGGRGPRAAGWYVDELKRKGISGSKGVVLQGGVKLWVSEYGDEPLLTTKL
jgi:arsenical-resistance protein 2